jgi:hypothetical protein
MSHMSNVQEVGGLEIAASHGQDCGHDELAMTMVMFMTLLMNLVMKDEGYLI